LVSTLEGHDTLAELHDVVASHAPAEVWQMLVRTLVGHNTLDPVQKVDASQAPMEVWHCVVVGR
jgi:hypothetical protein